MAIFAEKNSKVASKVRFTENIEIQSELDPESDAAPGLAEYDSEKRSR